MIRALQAPSAKGELDDVNLGESGCAEAIAIFQLAIERGNAEEMIRVVNLQVMKGDRELVELVGKFEAGLQDLIASEKGGRIRQNNSNR